MKSCGIVVEYNPFHNGHRYHAEQARKLSQADVVIAVMSGNFLQRGEPAIIDKWQRSQAALLNGVDLVIELPVEWAVQSADYFARGAVSLLHGLGCQALCFGTDGDTTFDYQAFGKFVHQNQGLINQIFQDLATTGWSYPQKMTAVFREIYPKINLDFASPNHILGLSYSKEVASYSKPMTLIPIKRQSAAYHDATLSTGKIASATAIRQGLVEEKEVEAYVPKATYNQLMSQPQVNWENYWPYLKYQLLTSSPQELQKIYQMSEGLEYRMQAIGKEAETFAEFMTKLKTKRYTWTRLQRLACYVLLNITIDEMERQQTVSKIRLLGMNQKGRAYLKEHKKEFIFPTISRVGKQEEALLSTVLKGDRVYQLGNQAISEQNFGRSPLIILE